MHSSRPATHAEHHNRTFDTICCLTANDRMLMIGRESGSVHCYTLPHVSLENKVVLPCRPQHLRLNCDATRMTCIDIHGLLSLWSLDSEDGAKRLEFERKVRRVSSPLASVRAHAMRAHVRRP